MINVHIPRFSYDKKIVLSNIEHQFETGQVHGIVGLNGAGKTTFFKLLSGYIKSEACQFLYRGYPMKRNETAFVGTELFLYSKLTAREFLHVFPKTNSNYNEEQLAEIFRLPLDELTDEFSTGMKKKLLLLSQLKQDKKIYILDEPFNGLDIETNKMLEVIISVLSKRGKTVFVSSHILEPLLNICQKIHHIQDGSFFTYKKENFNRIENLLFGKYKEEARSTLLQCM